MGLRNLFRGNPTPDGFANMLLERLKQGGEPREVVYEKESFTLRRLEDEQLFYLGNAFAEYERASAEDRENVVRVFLSTWFTSQFELPKSLADAKADILVTVRDRSYFEVDIPLCSDNLEIAESLVYCELAENLAVAPVYDMPTSIRSLSRDDLAEWDTTLYEIVELAKQNLKEMTHECGQMGELYLFSSGDSHDAARMLLTDVMESLNVPGAPIAMVPNREVLLVTGDESDEGLAAMLEVAKPALVHERRISSAAFRLEGGNWSPWLPPAGHRLRHEFATLRAQSAVGDYERQKELLEKRFRQNGSNLTVASFTALKTEDGAVRTYAIWAQDVPTLIPRTDYVFFMATQSDGSPGPIAAVAEWDRVQDEVGELMQREDDLYPARFRVTQFPSSESLARLGVAEWARET